MSSSLQYLPETTLTNHRQWILDGKSEHLRPLIVTPNADQIKGMKLNKYPGPDGILSIFLVKQLSILVKGLFQRWKKTINL